MGLSKILGNGKEALRTSTVCGTRAYLAPEMILRKPYGLSVDFWQFGCFIFELYAVSFVACATAMRVSIGMIFCRLPETEQQFLYYRLVCFLVFLFVILSIVQTVGLLSMAFGSPVGGSSDIRHRNVVFCSRGSSGGGGACGASFFVLPVDPVLFFFCMGRSV